jgi:hypothetical protein
MAISSTSHDYQQTPLPTEAPSNPRVRPEAALAPTSVGSPIAQPTDSSIGALALQADQPLPAARRLLVLVPNADVDELGFARRIWLMASPRRLAVIYLGINRNVQSESLARRRLINLAAITRDDGVSVATQLEHDNDWIRSVQRHSAPGDLIVCHMEQKFLDQGLRRRSLAQTLVSALSVPVCVLSGFYPELPVERPDWLRKVLAWVPPLVTLAVFFILQVVIARATTAWVQTTMLCLSVVAEFGLIMAWERFLGVLN